MYPNLKDNILADNGEWKFAPAYDLVYSSGFMGNHSTTINGHGNPDSNQLIEAGVKAGLQEKECRHIFKEVEEPANALIAFIGKK